MPGRRLCGFIAVAVVATACNGLPLEAPVVQPPVGPPPNPPGNPAPPQVLGRLVLSIDPRESFVGLKLRLHVAAKDVNGAAMSSQMAQVASSDVSVAKPEGTEYVQMAYPNAAPVSEVSFVIAMVGEGAAVLRARLGDVTDSVAVSVRRLPQALGVLAVDTFTVVEYRPDCVWACPYLLYAPLLKLREPTGVTFADVIAVEFSVPTMSTGLCLTGGLHFGSGFAAHINYIDPYPWANDMIFASLSGIPVPDGPARARVVVRDAAGTYSQLEATAPIQRMVTKPDFPMSAFNSVPWTCNDRMSQSPG